MLLTVAGSYASLDAIMARLPLPSWKGFVVTALAALNMRLLTSSSQSLFINCSRATQRNLLQDVCVCVCEPTGSFSWQRTPPLEAVASSNSRFSGLAASTATRRQTLVMFLIHQQFWILAASPSSTLYHVEASSRGSLKEARRANTEDL